MNVYTIGAPGTGFLQNKCMIGLFNGLGSARVVRIYRAWVLNNQTTAVTGVALVLEARRLTTGSGGTFLLPVKHDTQSPQLPPQVVTGTNLTYTASSLLRRMPWSSDEPSVSGITTIDEIETNPAFTQFFNYHKCYSNSTVQPIVLRPGEGFGIINTTNSIVGLADFFLEFSVETT